MNTSVQSIRILVLGYCLNSAGVFCKTSSFEGQGKTVFNSTATTLIHVVNILEAVPFAMSNLSAMSSNSKPKRSHINTASSSSSRDSLRFRLLLDSPLVISLPEFHSTH